MLKEKYEWIIDSGCSNNMIHDKSKFVKLEKFDGGVVRFGEDHMAKIFGIGSINFDGKHNTNNVFYVKHLNHNILSVGQMCGNGYNLVFQDDGCEIKKRSEIVIAIGKRKDGNVYPLRRTRGYYSMVHINES